VNNGLVNDGPGNEANNTANSLYATVSNNSGIRSFTASATSLQIGLGPARKHYEKA
jgi:hypothetical protein